MMTNIFDLYKHYLSHPLISTDSRIIKEDSIFFALKGENFDGNKFALNALNQGCSLAVVDDPNLVNKVGCFYVDDVLKTLQLLAIHHRNNLKVPFLGITGTNGKTTTKELIKNVLSKKFNTYATHSNFNNHIGVPLSILSINKEVEIAVIEMGANHIGEIDHLCKISNPDYGLITNIGIAHLEGFGSFEGVVSAKTELYNFLEKKGMSLVFVNHDDPLLMAKTEKLKRFTYGNSPEADTVFNQLSADPFAKIEWVNHKKIQLRSNLFGSYNAQNLMAAVCIGHFFEVDVIKIKEAIEEYHPENQRSQFLKTENNQLIVDAYNANPSSMMKAIDNFEQMKGHHKMMILGDMLELGKESISLHQQVIDHLIKTKIENILLVGKEFSACRIPSGWMHNQSTKLALDFLTGKKVQGLTILLKGSRGMKLEQLIGAL